MVRTVLTYPISGKSIMGTDQCIFNKPFYVFLKSLENLESLKESKSRLKIILLKNAIRIRKPFYVNKIYDKEYISRIYG